MLNTIFTIIADEMRDADVDTSLLKKVVIETYINCKGNPIYDKTVIQGLDIGLLTQDTPCDYRCKMRALYTSTDNMDDMRDAKIQISLSAYDVDDSKIFNIFI